MPPAVESLEPRRMLSGWSYVVGRDFAGSATHEALERIGQRRTVYVDCTFHDATTLARLNRCYLVGFDHCKFWDILGPADPNGQAIDWLNSTACWATHCQFEASPATCDLATAFYDVGEHGVCTVSYSEFIGAGANDYGNALCLDGPGSGALNVDHCDIWYARAGMTCASGVLATAGIRYVGCPVKVYAAGLYHAPALVLTDQPNNVLVGRGGSVGQVM